MVCAKSKIYKIFDKLETFSIQKVKQYNVICKLIELNFSVAFSVCETAVQNDSCALKVFMT
jgi:hypothetical protein